MRPRSRGDSRIKEYGLEEKGKNYQAAFTPRGKREKYIVTFCGFPILILRSELKPELTKVLSQGELTLVLHRETSNSSYLEHLITS